MYVKFLESVTVKDNSGRHFEKGAVVDLPEFSCRHWIIRKKAVFCDAPEVKEEAVIEDTQEEDAKKKHRRK